VTSWSVTAVAALDRAIRHAAASAQRKGDVRIEVLCVMCMGGSVLACGLAVQGVDLNL
jgi:hypothetical protein